MFFLYQVMMVGVAVVGVDIVLAAREVAPEAAAVGRALRNLEGPVLLPGSLQQNCCHQILSDHS